MVGTKLFCNYHTFDTLDIDQPNVNDTFTIEIFRSCST